jgi:FtsH-binding integral membrane protein
MPDLLAKALGSFLRHGLTILAGYIVAGGIWTPDEATTYVAAAVSAILALIWSLWLKYKDQILLEAARVLPANASMAEVKDKAAVEGSKLLG